MQVVSLDELSPERTGAWGSLVWSDHDPPQDHALFRRARALGVPFAEYVALFAVERGQVLAEATARHFSWTSPERTETFAGVSDVVTQPEVQHRGLCTRLLRELHRRERSQGIRWVMLWTRRSWGAHRLYERLGYRDIYSPPSAVLPPRSAERPRLGKGFSLRSARRTDAPVLESIFSRATRGRCGFVPRPPNSFRARMALGWRTAKDHHLLVRGSTPVGYFYATETPRTLSVYEGVVVERGLLPHLLDAMQRRAGRRWLTIGYSTLVTDTSDLLRERGFSLRESCQATLMARSLSDHPQHGIRELRRLARDPRFSCHRGDVF
jgi:GNAT superfamily N-acetyltransferase